MKTKFVNFTRSILVALLALTWSAQSTYAQLPNALTSVRIKLANFALSSDRTTITYDVLVHESDPVNDIAIPGFIFRLSVPQLYLGSNPKTVDVIGATAELGATSASMTVSGGNWLMSFRSLKLITRYADALMLPTNGEAVRIGKFVIKNANGALFSSPLTFEALFSGVDPLTKSTISIFDPPNSTTLSANSTTAQPVTNISGLGLYTINAPIIPLTISPPTLTLSKTYNGDRTAAVTAGTTVDGVLSADQGQVTVIATSLYDNSSVAPGKTITTTYSLIGDAKRYYSAPSDYVVHTGEITVKPITISAPTITKTKVYDGLTGTIVTAGTVNGNLDGSNLIVTPTANFNTKDVATGKLITVTYALTGSAAGNYAALANNTDNSGEITVKPITITAPTVTKTKVYDGLKGTLVTAGTVIGNLDGSNLIVTATANFYNKDIGIEKFITVTYALTGSAAGNYSAPANNTDSGDITPKPITITAPTITTTKVYDALTGAAVTAGTVTGNLDGGNLIVTPTGNYDTKNVGTTKTITVTYALTGSEAGNYSAPANNTVSTGVITAKPITVAAPTITTTKVYDALTGAAVTAGAVTGNLDGGNLIVTPTGNYDTKNVGTTKTITVTYALTGSEAGNYSAPANNTVSTGVITAKPITVTAPTITTTKVYDFGTGAATSIGTITGNLDGGNLIVTPTGNYDTKNVGTTKTITVTYALTGSEAGNYSAPANNTVSTGVITAKPITIAAPTITTTKVYDALKGAAVTAGAVTGNLDGGNLIVTPTGNYDTKNVGTTKTITVTYALSGSAATNYSAPANNTVSTGVITAKPITVTAPTITTTKVYDFGTGAATSIGTITGNLDGGNLIVTPTGNYDTKNVGTTKTITVTYALTGSEAGNYSAPANNTVSTGVITAKPITIAAPTITTTKVYDALTGAAVTAGAVTGNLDGGNLVVTPTGSYDTKNVGTTKTITVIYALSGSAATNYSAPANNTVSTGVITAKPITVTAPTITTTKVYDFGTGAATSIGTITGNLDGGNLIVTPTGNYDTKNVGTTKTITVTYALTGSEAGNYSAPANNTVSTGVITAKPITIAAPTITTTKVYDALTGAAVTAGAVTGNLDGGNLVVTPTGSYDTKNVGTTKTITVIYALSGSAATNYSAPANNTVSTGVITAIQLTASNPTLTLSKPYDGLTTAAVTKGTLSGVVGADVITLVPTANYVTAVVGTGKTINVVYTLTGTEATNYIAPITYSVNNGIITSSIVLTISNPTLTIIKTYDGLTSAAVTAGTLGGVLSGDNGNVNVAAVANYTDPGAGTSKTINVVYSISGPASANYSAPVNYQITNGVINAIVLTVANPTLTTSKAYDGLTTAVVTAGTPAGVIASDIGYVTLVPSANYVTPGVGSKNINVTYTLTGIKAVNYSAPTTYSTSGTITSKILTAANPALTISKPYDGTTSAVVTAGALTGVVATETANVTLVPTANYTTPTVSGGKTINVTYTLTGTAIANYTAPVPYQVTNGTITPKALTISNPTIAANKLYDGSTNAGVVAGTLLGVVSGESSSVTLSTAATFADATPGTNKTITVIYSLSGVNAGNYTTPSNFTSTGIIYKKLTLSVLLEGLWNGVKMNKAKDGIQDVYEESISDLITIELHDLSDYSKILYTFDNLALHQLGEVTTGEMGGIAVDPSITGSYRITVKTRNHLETASADEISFDGYDLEYDFTATAAKSYISDPSFTPTKLIDGKWMLYAGDSMKDSYWAELNFGDLYDVFNKRSNVGYTTQDLDGSGDVSDADLYLMFNNRDILLYIP